MPTLTTQPDVGTPSRRFLPAEFDPTDIQVIGAVVQTLLDRSVESGEALEHWLRDWSELDSVLGGALARRYIAMTCDTSDETAKEAYLAFERDIVPQWRIYGDRLNRALLANSHRSALGKDFAVYLKRKEMQAKIFREENNPLKTRDSELDTAYNEIQGAISVEFRGETLTAQQCGAYLEEQDRATREEAYLLLSRRRLEDRERMEEIFDEQLEIRQQIAKNAGFDNFRDYKFADYTRFDYGPADCETFHDAVERVVVPAATELTKKRCKRLGIDSMRPYDKVVSISGRPPIKPFADQASYERVARVLFAAVDPVFAGEFDILTRNRLLDLMSRPGKAPGGYNYPVEDIRLPFIFINGVGRHADVQTMLHEGGHAFHTLATRDQEVLDLRDAPTEFAEVASMSMEMMGMERFATAYSPEDARDAALAHLSDIITMFPWIATIDAFQHWLYTHPGHSREERTAEWIQIRTRFAPYLDWSGLEDFRDTEWHRQSHLFGGPFYYIEYGLAQIGALQVWQNERRDHDQAIADYRAALALGYTRSLPELFAAAGGRFSMDEQALQEVIPDVIARIHELSG